MNSIIRRRSSKSTLQIQAEILGALLNVWQEYPTLRLGQLMITAVEGAATLYQIEDHQLVQSFISFQKKMNAQIS